MQLFILGNNSDDIGNQLEKLTCLILEKMNFINITKNEIGSGGHEIDVRAEYVINSLNGLIKKPIICECKAYKSTVSMNDWLKFLGKVLIEETKDSVEGYFVALSGVNGNVLGNYRDLKSRKNNIHLITGEDLIKLLKEIFGIANIELLQKQIEFQTHRKPDEIILCYYNKEIYFLIGFSQNEFTLFLKDGTLMHSKELDVIRNLIINSTNYHIYIDLQNENKSLIRHFTIQKFIVSIFLHEIRLLNLEDIRGSLIKYEEKIPDITNDELGRAIEELLKKSIIVENDKSYILKVLTNGCQIEEVVDFYKYLLKDIVPLDAIQSETYGKNINVKLLSKICEIQGGIVILEKDIKNCIKILKWSPSALLWALNPQNIILTHRSGGKAVFENLEKEDTSIFLQKIINLLFDDYKTSELKDFFFSTLQLFELETNLELKVKSKLKLEIDMNYKDRIGLAQLTEEYKNSIILVRIFNDQPEPWEREIKNNT
jgi:hypothetical protein